MKKMNNDELYHYGIKGMKWGQRRAVNKIERISKRSKKEGWSDDATEAAHIKNKKVKQMSNVELKKLNERQSLEEKHKQLNPSAIKRGLMIAGATAAALGTAATLYKYGKTYVKGGQKIVKKWSNVSVSNKFWKGMRNTAKPKFSDFKDLLK